MDFYSSLYTACQIVIQVKYDQPDVLLVFNIPTKFDPTICIRVLNKSNILHKISQIIPQ